MVACNACHLKSAALSDKIPKRLRLELKRKKRPELFSLALFKITKPLDRCESCHQDVHKNQLDAHPCSSCHQAGSFKKVTLDHDRDTRYPLTGKHASTACARCHGAPAADRPVQYRPLPMVCSGCHPDVHAGQFAPAASAATDCERCHQTSDWVKTRFVHQPPFTAYLLEGKHAAAKCAGCHRVRYKPLPQECESCHSDFHQGAFKGFEP